MKLQFGIIGMIFAVCILLAPSQIEAARLTEYLDRGVVAVRAGNNVFISWRLFATEPQNIGFNVYCENNGAVTKLNSEVLTGGTNFTHNNANMTGTNRYFVKTVENGVEKDTDGSYTLPANPPDQAIVVPLRSGEAIHFVWVGDFNGDGKYDFLVDRLCWGEGCHQKLEAYLHDGTFLWEIDLGPGSIDKNNISPGKSTIDVGHWDGATVYDIDSDGYADVLLRGANGVVLGDGTVFNGAGSHTNAQSIMVIDGMTGKLKAHAPVPDDYINVGQMGTQLGVGHLDGRTPSLISTLKNRNSNGSFNMIVAAYGYQSGQFKMLWKWKRDNQDAPDGHQFRLADADFDGKDEYHQIGFALNSNGTFKYSLGSEGIVHGDRFYVGVMAKNENFMRGYGIQQDNPNGLLEYGYNASTGEVTWKNSGAVGDVGRGNIGDIDPDSPGYEAWSFQGTRSALTGEVIAPNYLYPVIRLWWDGDVGSESYNDGKIEGWNYDNNSVYRILTTWNFQGAGGSDRGAPMFYGDILGDWREEVVLTADNNSKLIIFSTTIPSDVRLYTLSQNQAYRAGMTIKGYYQSNMLDYYLGYDMDSPTPPALEYTREPEPSSSSSSDTGSDPSSSSSEGSTPILHSQLQISNLESVRYYSLRGESLGTAKPTKAGIYFIKQGASVKKIVVK